MAATEIFKLFGSVFVDNEKANRSIDDTDKKGQGLAGTFGNMVGAAAKWGVAMAAAGASAVAAFGGLSIKAAVDFEKQMANVATLLDGDVKTKIGNLGGAVKNLSATTGASTALLTDGLYQVISAFGESEESMRILETAAKGAAAGNATVTDSVNLLSAVTKGYGDTSVEAANKASDLAFLAVKLGQTTFPELASSMGKVIPVAASMGVSQEALFSVMATLTGVTGSAAEVSTQFRGVLQGLMKPTKDMAGLLEQMGYESGQAFLEAEGLGDGLMNLKAAAEKNGIGMENLFSSVEALTAAMALTGPQADVWLEKQGAMAEASGATEEAFKRQQATVSALMGRIKQSLNVVMINLGEQFLPMVNKVAEAVAARMPQIQAFFEKTFEAVGNAIGWISDNVLPMFQNTFQNASAFAGQAVEVFKDKVLPALQSVWDFIQTFVEAVSLIWNEFGDEIIQVWKIAAETIYTVLKSAFDIATGILDVFIGLFTGDWKRMGEGLKTIWENLWGGIEAILEGAWGLLKVAFGGLWDGISGWFANLKNDALVWGKEIVSGLWQGIDDMAGWLKDKVLSFAKGVGDTIKGFFGISSPSTLMAQYGKNVAEGLANGMEGNRDAVEKQGELLAKAAEEKSKEAKEAALEQAADWAKKIKPKADIMASAITDALDKVNKELNLSAQIAQAEISLMAAEMGEAGDQGAKLGIKLLSLQNQLSNSNNRVGILTRAYKDMKAAKGETAEETQKLYLELIKAQAEQAGLTNEVKGTEAAIADLGKVEVTLSGQLEQMDLKMRATNLLLDSAADKTAALKGQKAELQEQLKFVRDELAQTTAQIRDQIDAGTQDTEAFKTLVQQAEVLKDKEEELKDGIEETNDKLKEQAETTKSVFDKFKDLAAQAGVVAAAQIEALDAVYRKTGTITSLDIERATGGYDKSIDRAKKNPAWADTVRSFLGQGAGLTEATERARQKFAGLASGGVIDRPTLALLGETPQARPEIVTPEALMRQVVREETGSNSAIDYRRMAAEIADALQSAILDALRQAGSKELILKLDGTPLGRILLPLLIQEAQRLGVDLI